MTRASSSPTSGASSIARPATRRSTDRGAGTGIRVRVPIARRRASGIGGPTDRRTRGPRRPRCRTSPSRASGQRRGVEQRQREQRAGALAQAQVEVEQGVEAETLEGDARGGLGATGARRPTMRASPGRQRARRPGLRCTRRCRRGRRAVRARRPPAAGSPSSPRCRGCRHVASSSDRVVDGAGAASHRGRDGGGLALQRRVVDAGAAARDGRAGSTPVSSPMSVAAGVVLPIPMSPAISTSAPASIGLVGEPVPQRERGDASSTVIASSRSIDPLPRRMRSAQTRRSRCRRGTTGRRRR